MFLGATHITFTPTLQRTYHNPVHCTYRELIGLLINSNDSTTASPSSFQNSISGPHSVLEQKISLCCSNFQQLSWWRRVLQATSFKRRFVLKPTKQVKGPNSSSKDCSLNFPGSRLQALSGKETDYRSRGPKMSLCCYCWKLKGMDRVRL